MKKELEDSTPINRVHFGKSNRTYQYLATISVCLAAVGAGNVLAWSSPALTELAPPKPLNSTYNQDFPDLLSNNFTHNASSHITLTKTQEALLGSTLNVGALLYAVPAGYIADKFGRKIAIYSSAASYLLGWFLIVIANNVEMLLFARFFGGMGLGAICVVAPMYVGEIAENDLRATLGSSFQVFLSSGIFLTFIIGSFTDYITMSAILAIFPILLFVTFPFMPESHVHLVKKNKIKEAIASLTRFRGNDEDYDIQGEMQIIQEEVNKNDTKSSKFSDIISKRSNRNAFIANVGLLGLQQMCGINAVTFYSEQILAAAGTGLDPSTGSIIMSGLQLFGGYSAMTLIEKAGRKYFLILSSVGMMIGLCGLGMFFHLHTLNINTSGFGFLPIACAAIFIISFTLGYGSIPFMLMHELYAPEVRGIGSGIGIVSMWTCSFIVTYAFPISLVALGDYTTFYIMTVINAASIFFVVFFVPETRGKTLIEIQELLDK